MLGEWGTFGINGSFGAPEKNFSVTFSKAKTKICLSLHYNRDSSYLFVNANKNFKFKGDNGNVNLPAQFWLGSICNRFYATEFREVALGGNVSVFSVDYNAVDNSDILNIHKYLMFKNNIKINLKNLKG